MILKKLEKGKNHSRWWQASKGGNGMHDMKNGSEEFAVDTLDKTCTYGAWLLSGISYCHALAVTKEEKLNPSQFVNECYNVEKTLIHIYYNR